MNTKTQNENAAKNVPVSAETKTASESKAKFIIATSSSFIARRVTNIPVRRVEFSKLTQRAQLDYLKDCAIKGVLPNIAGECEIGVKGLFGVDYLKALINYFKETSEEQIIRNYYDVFEKRDATSTEKRLLGLYLETGQIVYPNLTDKVADVASMEQEAEESEEGKEE